MHAPSPVTKTLPVYQAWLYRYACFCAGAVLFLLSLGGVVTSKNAGMSVPDWPTSYGYNMFYFPWQDMVGGIFWEHSHRVVGSGVGTLILLLAVALCFQPRVWLRWLGLAAALMVSLQGILGGLRVIEMNAAIGIFHACLAQVLFLTVSLIALFSSRWWLETRAGQVPWRWTGRAGLLGALIFAQLTVGAVMRHEHAGLSIDDFPLAYGQLWPSVDAASLQAYNLERLKKNELPTTPLYIEMQMVHRVGGLLITTGILAAAWTVWRTPGSAALLRKGTAVWVGLIFIQVALGIFTIWTHKAADVATTHMAVGALVLDTAALLTAMSWRLRHPAL